MASDHDRNTRWEGFSNYQSVSDRMARSIEQAIRAYSVLDSRLQESAKISPDQAAEVRSKILTPAIRLMPEMESEREHVDVYDDILTKWEGGNEDDDEGYIERINQVQLQSQSPGWLLDFVLDIRTAGFELGYLQAGRTVKEEPDDPTEAEAEAMFGNL